MVFSEKYKKLEVDSIKIIPQTSAAKSVKMVDTGTEILALVNDPAHKQADHKPHPNSPHKN